jgi:hypothetical protein
LLLIVAILANVVLVFVCLSLFNVIVNPSSEPDMAQEGNVVATEEPTAIETIIRAETPTPMMPATLTATPTLLPTPLATLTPEPTRREFLEPTKPPYVFPTPIYIPTTPRERPTPTRAR